jgi:competence protein ComK
MKEYEINNGTLAIVPTEDGKTKVYETDDEFIVDKRVYQVMEESCQYFGSSLIGRQTGSKNILGSSYKVPVVIDESRDIIFFPTSSPLLDSCYWIGLKDIKEIIKKDRKTIIVFDNNKEIEVDIPYLSIQNQIMRATRLNMVLKKRKN